ncbi:MAG: ATP-binding cassette domain-containing protein, partial [Planctomycetota bacterium]
MNAVTLTEVDVHLGDHHALDRVSWQVALGTTCAVVGPNGAGKSTLLKVLLGLIKPQAGSVQVLAAAPGVHADRVGFVPQVKGMDRHFPALPLDLVSTGLRPRWPWRR